MAEGKQNLVNAMEQGLPGESAPPSYSAYPNLPTAFPAAYSGPTPPAGAVGPPLTTTPSGLVPGILGAHAITLECPNCRVTVQTRTESRVGGYAWMIFGILLIMGSFLVIPWLFCWIPFCKKNCKDVEHYCPNCAAKLGRYKRGN